MFDIMSLKEIAYHSSAEPVVTDTSALQHPFEEAVVEVMADDHGKVFNVSDSIWKPLRHERDSHPSIT